MRWVIQSAVKRACGKVKRMLANGKASEALAWTNKTKTLSQPYPFPDGRKSDATVKNIVFLAKTMMNSSNAQEIFPEFQNLYIIRTLLQWRLQINYHLILIHHEQRESMENILMHKLSISHISLNNALFSILKASVNSAWKDLHEHVNELQNYEIRKLNLLKINFWKCMIQGLASSKYPPEHLL